MSDIFNEEVTFHQLGLNETVCRGVEDAGFKHPTDIQARLIPQMLAGKDVLGQAKTGTGKTAAFGLPLLQMIDPDEGTCALVLAPTRELAIQIVHELMDLAKHTPHQAIAIVGGESYQKQIDALKKGSSIVVGTPGRVMDLNQKRLFSYHNLKYVVLDEVDRMLDIGFRDDIRNILSRIKGDHQTVFVSATISDPIEKLARQFMGREVEKITTVAKSLTVSQVTQRYLSVPPWDKDRLTAHLLKHEEPALTVIFCRTKRKVDKLCRYLQRKNIDAVAIHGNLAQTKRNRIMSKLRSGELEVLVASDLASRGLDVEGISHVINYDLPDDIEVYVHRIGRTARAGRQGTAYSFVTPDQGQHLTEIEKLTGVEIKNLKYDDFEPKPRPDNWVDELPGGRRGPAPPVAPPPKSRNEEKYDEEDKKNEALFPGGIAPKGPPKKNLASRFRRRGR
ncbi:MAG: DEAD/DEAH box helicase [Phycisphaeraceae bacterium]|nr:DEAD/DEAH box helicase [Phycisphaeraceae bacterium]